MDNKEIRALARQIAQARGIRTGSSPRHLTVADPVGGRLNAMQRDVLYARIGDLAQLHSLQWLVRQETMHVCGVIECLDDDELRGLLATLERAIEAQMDGVPFVEVGLIRGVDCNWVA